MGHWGYAPYTFRRRMERILICAFVVVGSLLAVVSVGDVVLSLGRFGLGHVVGLHGVVVCSSSGNVCNLQGAFVPPSSMGKS